MKTFNELELQEFFDKHCNLSYNYFKKFENINNFVNLEKWEIHNGGWGQHFPEQMDVTRIFSLLDLKEWVQKYDIKSVNKLLVLARDPEIKLFNYQYLKIIRYEENRNYDLHSLDLSEKDFDFFIFPCTIEHLYNPYLAMEKITEHIKPGGYVFCSAPVNNIPHLMPFYFNNFTPFGLAMLFITFGYEILEVGQYGSQKFIDFMYQKLTWPNYTQMMDENGFIENDINRPCHCWVLAKKL